MSWKYSSERGLSGAAGRVVSVRAPKQRTMKRSARSCAVRVVLAGLFWWVWMGGGAGGCVVEEEDVDEVVEYEPGDAAAAAAA